MTKILIPLLILAGLAVGLFLLVRGRRVRVPDGATGLKLVMFLAAAAIAGGVGVADAKGKPKKTCYKVAPIDDTELTAPDDVKGSIEKVMKRIEKLEKLYEAGKLTDAVYFETFAEIDDEIEKIEITKKNKGKLTEAEKKLVDLRRAMDNGLLNKLAKHKSWKTLVKQARELRKYIAGKVSSFSKDKVDDALDDLASKDLIDATTKSSLSTVLGAIAYHHERSTAGKTCYKMSSLGIAFSSSRAKLTELFEKLDDREPTQKEFHSHLVTLAMTVPCLAKQTEAACDVVPFPDTGSRVELVTTLSLFSEMSR